MAELRFYYGCMNAGKTTELLKTYEIYNRKNLKPVIIKPQIDTREGVQTGWGVTSSRLIKKAYPAFYIKTVKEDLHKIDYKTILVDEAQFLTREDVLELSRVVDKENINVLAYGLKTDVNGHLFQGAQALLEFADKSQELETLCDEYECTNKASMHIRYIDGKPDKSGQQVAIEQGNVTYKSVCRKHWYQALFDR